MARRGVIVAVVAVAGIIGFMFVNGALEFNQENLTESVKDLPENLKESIQNIQESIPEIPVDTSSIIPPKSKLIGKSKIVNQIEYTVTDVYYADSGYTIKGLRTASEYSTYMVIEMKIVNLGSVSKAIQLDEFAIHDQHNTEYVGWYQGGNPFKPSVPTSGKAYFEISKDESFEYTLHVPDKNQYPVDRNRVMFGPI